MLAARDFSYATSGVKPWRRGLIRGIEHLTGQPRLWRLYESYGRETAAVDKPSRIRICEIPAEPSNGETTPMPVP